MRLLRALDDHLHQRPGDPLPLALIEQLHAARKRAEGGTPLEVALGVDRARRDAALRRAAELLHDNPAGEPWTAAGAVLFALKVYTRRPRNPLTEAERALAAAIDAGLVVLSQKQVARILAG